MLLFLLIAALVALTLASLEDLRSREVPDWLSYGMIFLGVGTALIYSIAGQDYSIFFNSLAGLALCLILGHIMFYSAQWGGGDSKLLMGLGAIIGLNVFNLSEFPTLITLMINILLIGAFYGLIWSFFLAIKKRKKFVPTFRKFLYSNKVVMARKGVLVLAVLIFIGIIFASLFMKIILFAVMVFIFCSLYMWIFVKSVEESCMIKSLEISKLTEGDWIVKDVVVKGKRICGPKDLGIKKEQIAELKKLKAKGLIKQVIVKEGIPFVPSFLLGFLATIIWGTWFLTLF